ncbi:MAG: type VI secretion system membrane subunit TssM [Chitinispirillaceae bacterium]
MRLFKKKKKKKPAESFAVNHDLCMRITKEVKVATGRYVDSVKRTNLFKSSALYGNPWFMVLGPEGCGKSSLLYGSGLNFPLRYPQERDGETASGLKWNFGNRAVWIDVPGKLLRAESADSFKAVYRSIQECRNKRSADGIVLAVNVEDILNGDQQSVKALADSMRSKLDELISFWGIELPVFTVFTKADLIPGFYEFFNDESVLWSEQLLGATLSKEQQKASARSIFTKEHENLCSVLKTLRLKRLSTEKKESSRRLICRFVIQFEGIQARAADFLAELFKDSAYEGKPIFKGFYFTSCRTFESTEEETKAQSTAPQNISNTVLNHPLNPHRAAVGSAAPPSTDQFGKKQIRPFFISKLLSSIIPGGTQVLQRTQRFSRKEMIRYWSSAALFTLLFLAGGWYLMSSFNKTKKHNEMLQLQIASAMKSPRSRMDAYKQLGRLGELVIKYQHFRKSGPPLSFGPGFIKAKQTYSMLKKVYLDRCREYLIIPSAAFLEHAIKRHSKGYGELGAEDYSALYRYLKSYLSMSESVAQHSGRIDTLALRETIENGFISAVLRSENIERLPARVETSLRHSFSLYCRFLKTGDAPLIQENQNLVKMARKRLSRIPGAKTMYESLRHQLRSTAPTFSIEDILGQTSEGILSSSKKMSTVYTQEGWDRYVDEGITSATKDPFRVDWVLGASMETKGAPAFDKEELRREITALYLDDVYYQWIDFLRYVQVESAGDMVRSGAVLQKLASERSELKKLFQSILELSQIDVSPKGNAATDAIGEMAQKKGGKVVQKVKQSGYFSKEDPADKLKSLFSPIRAFAQSEGRLGGMAQYQERISVLAESMLRVAKTGEVTIVFNGREEDPLLAAWQHTDNVIASLPDEVGRAAASVLQRPIESAGLTLSSSISKELNDKWQSEVASVFTNGFAGKYPLSRSESEAPFESVMEFFRPNTGTFWGFYERNLKPYLKKEVGSWKARQVGCIQMEFKSELPSCMTKAQQISSVFFNSDGTMRSHTVSVKPLSQNKHSGTLVISSKEKELKPDGPGIRFQWPITEQSDKFGLKIRINDDYTEEITFDGPWGIMRLFEVSRINTLNSSTFNASWNRNVQNMLMVRYGCSVRVSGSKHPFGKKVFSGFDCPMEILD